MKKVFFIALTIGLTACNPMVKDFEFPTERKVDKNGNPMITGDFNRATITGYLMCPITELEVDFWSSSVFASSNHYKVRCASKSDLWYECKQSSQLYSCKNSAGVVFHNQGLSSIFD